ncbi:MAG: hypothetical protein SXU28_12115, partial [Pseudomonadota bacterium]|nr:hypothetical protein [Pseudomonadota bacterium]
PPLGLRPPGVRQHPDQVAWFCSAQWPTFTPPLTGAPVSAQSASAANMPALLQKVAKHNPQYLPK